MAVLFFSFMFISSGVGQLAVRMSSKLLDSKV